MFVDAAEVREATNKEPQVCGRARVGERPVSRKYPVSWVTVSLRERRERTLQYPLPTAFEIDLRPTTPDPTATDFAAYLPSIARIALIHRRTE